MTRSPKLCCTILGVLAFAVGCEAVGPSGEAPDPVMDATLTADGMFDAGGALADAGPAPMDAAPSGPDMGVPEDASPPPPDAVAPNPHDAGAGDYVSPWPNYESELYSNTALWNCHPGRADGPCGGNLDSTIVHPDGRLEVVPLVRAENPPVDCFYVYSTCSVDQSLNADLEAGEEELFVTELQAARLVEHCRVFAPEYRQVSVTGLLNGAGVVQWRTAYEDVADAFKHYMTHFNGGRGVVLIGHSQGGLLLKQLITEEIDGVEALQRQLVSAYLLGAGVEVPWGQVVSGAFDHIPLCTDPDQAGCVVTYASYRVDEVFGPQHVFGRTNVPGVVLGCTNPAGLDGGRVPLGAQFPTRFRSRVRDFITGNTSPFADAERVEEITTPFFSVPGLIEGECVLRNGHHFLAVTVTPDPDDPRADEIGGDMVIPGWGLHMIDVNLAADDIKALIARQISAYAEAGP